MAEERKRNEKGVFLNGHGQSKTELYSKWCGMKRRCNVPHDKSYPRYGGKGIKICEEWNDSFPAFYEWAMRSGYKPGLTIDRIDNSKGYLPENCRWATVAQQNRNYSRNHLITYQGRTQCLADWADETGVNRTTLLLRIKRGWSMDRLFDKRDGRSLRYGRKTDECI